MANICHSYYNEPDIRRICHAVKNDNDYIRQTKAIARIANDLAERGMVKPGDYLIPAPQHMGKAVYTAEIASIIADKTGAYVCDILRCVPHIPVHSLKQKGIKPDIKLYLGGSVPRNGTLFFVDNVMATGETFEKANALLGGRLIPLVYAVDEDVYNLFRRRNRERSTK